MRRIFSLAAAAWLASMMPLHAEIKNQPAAWSEPTQPFKIVDNLYYVGTKGLAAYLFVSGNQAILLDGTLDGNVPSVERNIRSLGFRLEDVKIILNSHAHFDHAAGIARLKKDTHAQFMAMEQDKSALEQGRQEGDTTYGGASFPAVKVDKTLHDGDLVSLGDLNLTATLTAGHSKGCTTWSTEMTDHGVSRRVVFPCSISVAGNILVGNKGYPGIVGDFRKSFDKLAAMKADIVLPAHPELTDLFERKADFDAGDENAFVDTELLQDMVEKARTAFEKELTKERK
jgi:metallo-beta-lactamase class B